jgi:hypothetical protein
MTLLKSVTKKHSSHNLSSAAVKAIFFLTKKILKHVQGIERIKTVY